MALSEIGDFGAVEAVLDLEGVGTLSVSSNTDGIGSSACFGGNGKGVGAGVGVGVGVGVGIGGDSINVHCNETISESCPRSVCNTMLSRQTQKTIHLCQTFSTETKTKKRRKKTHRHNLQAKSIHFDSRPQQYPDCTVTLLAG